MTRFLLPALAAALLPPPFAAGPASAATKIGIIAFQMSADTHARTAGAAEAAAKAKGWEVTVLNSRGSEPDHAAQLENLVQSGVDGIILCMGKVQQLDAQLEAAQKKGIPVISVMSGTSARTLFDVNVNEFEVGAKIGVHLLGLMNYEGGLLLERYEGHGGTRTRGKVMDAILSENTGVTVLDAHTMARTKTWQEDVKNGMSALMLKNAGKFRAIWTSFDAQGYIVDDLLQAQGMKKGDVLLTGVDGGQETFRRIRDPQSLFTATVAIPFESMGAAAVDAMEQIAVKGRKKAEIVAGPYLYMSPVLVDSTNVPAEGKWPW